MKFLVDKLPKNKDDCYYAEWIPYPPIMEECGKYTCKLTGKKCNLTFDDMECEGLKIDEQFLVFEGKNQ